MRPDLPLALVHRILMLLPDPVLVCSVNLVDKAACGLVKSKYSAQIRADHPDVPLWFLQQYIQLLCPADRAAEAHLQQLEQLQEFRAAAGDLAGVKLLLQVGVGSPRAITAAVKAGQIHVVDHLLCLEEQQQQQQPISTDGQLDPVGSGKDSACYNSSNPSNPSSSSSSSLRCCSWDRQVLCHTAARHGQLKMLQHLRLKLRCPWDAGVCAAAAAGGHLHVLQWLHVNGCAWCPDTCFEAAMGGHLKVLQYAVALGCPYDAATSLAAAIKGHFHVLLWLKALEEAGVPSNALMAPGILAAGLGSGNPLMVQWLREQGVQS